MDSNQAYICHDCDVGLIGLAAFEAHNRLFHGPNQGGGGTGWNNTGQLPGGVTIQTGIPAERSGPVLMCRQCTGTFSGVRATLDRAQHERTVHHWVATVSGVSSEIGGAPGPAKLSDRLEEFPESAAAVPAGFVLTYDGHTRKWVDPATLQADTMFYGKLERDPSPDALALGRVALRNARLSSAITTAVKNLEATELAGLPSIAHVIRSLKDAHDG